MFEPGVQANVCINAFPSTGNCISPCSLGNQSKVIVYIQHYHLNDETVEILGGNHKTRLFLGDIS